MAAREGSTKKQLATVLLAAARGTIKSGNEERDSSFRRRAAAREGQERSPGSPLQADEHSRKPILRGLRLWPQSQPSRAGLINHVASCIVLFAVKTASLKYFRQVPHSTRNKRKQSREAVQFPSETLSPAHCPLIFLAE